MTEGAILAPPRPQLALGRQTPPAPNRRRLEGLAAGFEPSGRATAPPSPATPGLAQGASLGASAATPARRDTGEVVAAAAAAAAEARWHRPPPCSGPRPLAEDGAAAPPRPASPCGARRKPRSAPRLSSCGGPTALVTTRRPRRAAHAAASEWRVVSSAAATGPVRERGPAATQRQAGDSPGAQSERGQWSRPPAGVGDGLPGGPCNPPLRLQKMERSEVVLML